MNASSVQALISNVTKTITQMILVSMATFQLLYNWDRLHTFVLFSLEDLN